MATQSNNNTNYGGITFLGLLTIVFIVLKLTDVITWSWWLVLAPLWIPWLLFVVVGVGSFIYFMAKALFFEKSY